MGWLLVVLLLLGWVGYWVMISPDKQPLRRSAHRQAQELGAVEINRPTPPQGIHPPSWAEASLGRRHSDRHGADLARAQRDLARATRSKQDRERASRDSAHQAQMRQCGKSVQENEDI